ncbi:ABC transporter substrate-binding protein, partial [Streptococcus pyogenes]
VTNGVVALSKGLDVELIWLHELLGTNEALVTRKQEDLKDLHQLSGKTIATTFASTSHYSLKKVLEANNLTDKVTVLD